MRLRVLLAVESAGVQEYLHGEDFILTEPGELLIPAPRCGLAGDDANCTCRTSFVGLSSRRFATVALFSWRPTRLVLDAAPDQYGYARAMLAVVHQRLEGWLTGSIYGVRQWNGDFDLVCRHAPTQKSNDALREMANLDQLAAHVAEVERHRRIHKERGLEAQCPHCRHLDAISRNQFGTRIP